MVEISQAVNVSTSTLQRWARESGWREEDLAAQVPSRSGEDAEGAEAGSHPDDRQEPAQPPLDDEAGAGEIAPHTAPPDAPLTSALTSPGEAAEVAFEKALSAMTSGNMIRAERAARLALKFKQIASLESEVSRSEPPRSALSPAQSEFGGRDPRELLLERFERLGAAQVKAGQKSPESERGNPCLAGYFAKRDAGTDGSEPS